MLFDKTQKADLAGDPDRLIWAGECADAQMLTVNYPPAKAGGLVTDP